MSIFDLIVSNVTKTPAKASSFQNIPGAPTPQQVTNLVKANAPPAPTPPANPFQLPDILGMANTVAQSIVKTVTDPLSYVNPGVGAAKNTAQVVANQQKTTTTTNPFINIPPPPPSMAGPTVITAKTPGVSQGAPGTNFTIGFGSNVMSGTQRDALSKLFPGVPLPEVGEPFQTPTLADLRATTEQMVADNRGRIMIKAIEVAEAFAGIKPSVYIDSKFTGSPPVNMAVTPGQHTVSATLPGMPAPAVQQVYVNAGQTKEVTFPKLGIGVTPEQQLMALNPAGDLTLKEFQAIFGRNPSLAEAMFAFANRVQEWGAASINKLYFYEYGLNPGYEDVTALASAGVPVHYGITGTKKGTVFIITYVDGIPTKWESTNIGDFNRHGATVGTVRFSTPGPHEVGVAVWTPLSMTPTPTTKTINTFVTNEERKVWQEVNGAVPLLPGDKFAIGADLVVDPSWPADVIQDLKSTISGRPIVMRVRGPDGAEAKVLRGGTAGEAYNVAVYLMCKNQPSSGEEVIFRDNGVEFGRATTSGGRASALWTASGGWHKLQANVKANDQCGAGAQTTLPSFSLTGMAGVDASRVAQEAAATEEALQYARDAASYYSPISAITGEVGAGEALLPGGLQIEGGILAPGKDPSEVITISFPTAPDIEPIQVHPGDAVPTIPLPSGRQQVQITGPDGKTSYITQNIKPGKIIELGSVTL